MVAYTQCALTCHLKLSEEKLYTETGCTADDLNGLSLKFQPVKVHNMFGQNENLTLVLFE